MDAADKIEQSLARKDIDVMIMEDFGYPVIARKIKEKHGLEFTTDALREYHKTRFKRGASTVHQIIKVTQDITKNDPPPDDDRDKLAQYFGFNKTCEDLDLIYERIRDLQKEAKINPEDAHYDRRIREYLAQAEAIRTRVFRHQYENIRKAILLTVGKKLCTAAVSELMPYVPREKKAEALKRFQSAIEPLLDMQAVPDVPDDIKETNGGVDH